MEHLSWLLDKFSIPVVFHDNHKIIYANPSFKLFLESGQLLNDINFTQWLTDVIKNEETIQPLLIAIENNHEIVISTDSHLKGVARYWQIISLPIQNRIRSEATQITFFQDLSATKMQKSYWDLNLRVSKATMQLLKEIAERKRAEVKAAELSEQLIMASRRAGMADVADSVLHNIGNVLNSVNISASLVTEQLQQSKLSSLTKLSELIQEYKEDLGAFIKTDPRGAHLAEYLINLTHYWQEEKTAVSKELSSLSNNIDHIRGIVAMQQSMSKSVGVVDTVVVADVLEDALKVNESLIKGKEIQILRNYKKSPTIQIDKIKLLQIVVNLLRNAVESLLESKVMPQQLTLEILPKDDENIIIKIIDNGVGISEENLSKLFTHGFTTKANGHGFGLHTSILAAQELRGKLTLTSTGLGKGATAELLLPIRSKS